MKAVSYSRFSPRPNSEECTSVQAQKGRIRAYCQAMGYQIEHEFDDEALSGGSVIGRPGLEKALNMACQSKAVLIVTDISRLARNTKDAIDIADTLEKAGAHLAFLDMHIDTTSPSGRFFFTIMAAFAQMYRENISERTSKAMRKHQAAGRCMGSRAPYGYRIQPTVHGNILVPEPAEQIIVEEILDRHSKGETDEQIFRALKHDMLYRGRTWRTAYVRRIIDRVPPGAPAPAKK